MKKIRLLINLVSLKFRILFLELSNKKNRLIKEKKFNKSKNDIYAFLDLNNFRSTFDVVGFLLYCKIKSLKKKLTIIIFRNIPNEVSINPAKEKDFIGSHDSTKIREDNIVKVCLDIIEDFNPKIIFISDRNEANDYLSLSPEYKIPPNAQIDKIIDWDKYYIYINKFYLKYNTRPSLKAPSHYNNLVKLFIKKNEIKKKIITITLRDSSYFPLRNSTIDNWKKVYRYLEENDYYPIILDDMENISIDSKKNELMGYNTYNFANIDQRLRLALYEEAFLNLSVNHGPSQLLIYSKYCNFLIFKHYVNDETSPASLERIEKITGLKKNEQYPFFNNKQKLVWNINDDYELIIDEFKKIINT